MIRTAIWRMPKWKRLKTIEKSKNYKNDMFQNINITKTFSPKSSYISLIKKYINLPKESTPAEVPVYQKANLKNTVSDKPTIIWFGHSSYIIYIQWKVILVDPVFSKNASPVSFIAKSFDWTNIYTVDDLPYIDILLITHDHYDHLDYETIKKIKSKVEIVVTGLWVGEHFEYWWYKADKIIELDRWNSIDIWNFCITSTPARHFSGRNLKRNTSLWSSFVLKTLDYQIYIWWDSGYDSHFKEIWNKFWSFDIAILECWQYNNMRSNIHMMPEEVVQAWIDLNAKLILPVHRGKFNLSMHPRNEPIKRFVSQANKLWVSYTTPMISESIVIWENIPQNTRR